MCDYSLQSVKSRSAKVGDKLITRDFGTGTRGFAASEYNDVAVCVLPGTELSFASEVRRSSTACLHGATRSFITRLRSFGRSTRGESPLIMTPWNFPTAR